MSEPYGVLNAGEWSVRCRACSWRSGPHPADPLVFRASLREAEAEWRAHLCTQAQRPAGERLSVAVPPGASHQKAA